MKKRNGLFRLLFLLALIISMSMPLSVFAAEEMIDDIPVEDMVLPELPDAGAEANPDPYGIMPLAYNYSTIPESMLDNSILRALEYTGYDVQHQKDTKTLYSYNYFSSRLLTYDPDVLSGIPYSSDGSGSGLETVTDSSTLTGKAPNIAHFRDVTGLDCADFCAYYLCTYLPNIEGVDTSIFTQYRSSLGMRPDDMRFWQAACEDMSCKGLLDEYQFSVSDSQQNTQAYQDVFNYLTPGDLIRFGTDTQDWVHYGIYAGTYDGEHYMIHVGNSRGPEITLIRYMASSGSSKQSYPLAFYHFYWNDVQQDGIIQVNKKDTAGAALAGAEFTATNTATGDKYLIGPTDSNGYAKADKIPFGTYTIVETKFPAGYQASGTSSWTVTLNKDTPDATVTINATNALITGNLKLVKATNTGENLGGWQIGIYTDSACTKPISGSPFTTGADGTITVPGLVPGTYYCRELAVSDPYWATDTAVKTVTVSGNKTVTVTFRNTHYGKLRVQKIAVNGSAKGWNFRIYDSGKHLIGTITTGEDGYAYSPLLLPGTYYVVEVHDKSEVYWTYDATVEKQVTVTAGSQAQVSYTNIQYGIIMFQKTTNTGSNLAGWTFRVTDSDGNHVGDYVTDEMGYASSEKLAPGRYYVTELGNGDPYWICDLTPHVVDVSAGKMVGSVWKNTHVGQCIIRKQTDTGEDLEGWTITIYSDPECTQVIDTLTTAADGSALCYLEPGIYYAKETGDLYGRFEDSSWSIDTEVKEFTIVEGQDTEITFRNSRRSGTISIQKVDIYGEPLTGAKFLLEWSEDGIVWTEIARSDTEDTVKGESADEGTQTSPEDGIIQWRNLHPGVLYRITELDAPEGFQLLGAPAFEGTLPESNPTVTLCVVNARTFTLPETGSRSAALLPLSAALCLALCAGALLWLRKKEG